MALRYKIHFLKNKRLKKVNGKHINTRLLISLFERKIGYLQKGGK